MSEFDDETKGKPEDETMESGNKMLQESAAETMHKSNDEMITEFDDQIAKQREVLDRLCPPGDAGRVNPLYNRADALYRRFLKKDDIGDLDEAIEMLRSSLELHPVGHRIRTVCFYAAYMTSVTNKARILI